MGLRDLVAPAAEAAVELVEYAVNVAAPFKRTKPGPFQGKTTVEVKFDSRFIDYLRTQDDEAVAEWGLEVFDAVADAISTGQPSVPLTMEQLDELAPDPVAKMEAEVAAALARAEASEAELAKLKAASKKSK